MAPQPNSGSRHLYFRKNVNNCGLDKPASLALSVASRYALPGYGDRRVRVRGPAGPIIVSGYSSVYFEIKFSGKHSGFDGVLFNL